MLRIRDLILPETHDVSELYYHAAQALHVRASDIAALHIFRRSLDARKKPDLRWVYTVDVTLRSGEGAVLRRCRSARKDTPRPACRGARRLLRRQLDPVCPALLGAHRGLLDVL